MKRITLIGCGNIGTRLLQSIVTMPEGEPLELTCIDPSEDQLDLAENRIKETADGDMPPHIDLMLSTDFTSMKPGEDLAIIATASRPRADLTLRLLGAAAPRRLLLEKFLFTKRSDYAKVATALAAAGVETFVHTPRPTWPGYQSLSSRLERSRPVRMTVSGSNWALASNAVHFIAAFQALSGEPNGAFDASGLDAEPVENKRAGYMDVTGTLSFRTSGGSELVMTSLKTGSDPIVVHVDAAGQRFEIHENARQIRPGDAPAETFNIRFASQMQPVLQALIQGASHDLPSYQALAPIHVDLIEIFNAVVFGAGSADRACPVT